MISAVFLSSALPTFYWLEGLQGFWTGQSLFPQMSSSPTSRQVWAELFTKLQSLGDHWARRETENKIQFMHVPVMCCSSWNSGWITSLWPCVVCLWSYFGTRNVLFFQKHPHVLNEFQLKHSSYSYCKLRTPKDVGWICFSCRWSIRRSVGRPENIAAWRRTQGALQGVQCSSPTSLSSQRGNICVEMHSSAWARAHTHAAVLSRLS